MGLMGLPPVVAGLIVFLLLSRSGPLGDMGLLFSPTAMTIAQCLLVLPIIIALTRQTVEDLWGEYREHLLSLDLSRLACDPHLAVGWPLSPSQRRLLAGFGRASAEVGAVLIVGGNIAGYTRTMTTSIALETSKGDLPLALGLGMVLIALDLDDQWTGLWRQPDRGALCWLEPRSQHLPLSFEAVSFHADQRRLIEAS